MKKTLFVTISILAFGLAFSPSLNTFAMMSSGATDSETFAETTKETAQGRDVWNKLQSKEITCQDISNDDFEAIGEYLMEQMMGNSHQTMNKMMEQMMGSENEEQMRITMAKRMTGCDPQAEFSDQQIGFMSTMLPMMTQMMGTTGGGMMSGASATNASWWDGMGTMMGTGLASFMWLGAIFSILFWILIIVAIIAMIKWILIIGRGKRDNNTALDILKERYAKGEIGKEEFEQKMRELKNI